VLLSVLRKLLKGRFEFAAQGGLEEAFHFSFPQLPLMFKNFLSLARNRSLNVWLSDFPLPLKISRLLYKFLNT
jgi:hypothetical protein